MEADKAILNEQGKGKPEGRAMKAGWYKHEGKYSLWLYRGNPRAFTLLSVKSKPCEQYQIRDEPLTAEMKATLKSAVVCGCGSAYSRMRWAQLPLAGWQDDGEGGWLELRNCRCGSTRAIQMSLPPTSPVPAAPVVELPSK